MKTHHMARGSAASVAACLFVISQCAQAEQFIGFGQPGVPGRWALESFPVFSRNTDGQVRSSANTVLSYFSETGLTGTQRDQFQTWVGAVPGYFNQSRRKADAWGVASPNLGFAYYYNVRQPVANASPEAYRTFWTNPTLMLEFPTGNRNTEGYAAGANRYAASFSVANYLRIGRFAATFTPVGIHYAAPERHASRLGDETSERLRGGVSWWLADIAAGYLLSDDLWLGVHHAYHLNNRSAPHFKRSREGKVGPSVTYSGFARQGLYLSANLNFDYYHSDNLAHTNSLTMALVKFF